MKSSNLVGKNHFQIFGWGHGLEDIFTFWRAARNSRFIDLPSFKNLTEKNMRF